LNNFHFYECKFKYNTKRFVFFRTKVFLEQKLQ
jgi:hypothetical protein